MTGMYNGNIKRRFKVGITSLLYSFVQILLFLFKLLFIKQSNNLIVDVS